MDASSQNQAHDAFAMLSSSASGASSLTYASVVDNGTNDPIFAPGR